MRPVEERFWEKVDTNGDCWVWTASRLPKGYGMFKLATKHNVQAHRLSYQMHHGNIPEGMMVLHTCDNPSCVRPEHLYLGTHADNMRDRSERKRDRDSRKTNCIYGHPFSGDNLVLSGGRRYCRQCMRRRDKKRRAK